MVGCGEKDSSNVRIKSMVIYLTMWYGKHACNGRMTLTFSWCLFLFCAFPPQTIVSCYVQDGIWFVYNWCLPITLSNLGGSFYNAMIYVMIKGNWANSFSLWLYSFHCLFVFLVVLSTLNSLFIIGLSLSPSLSPSSPPQVDSVETEDPLKMTQRPHPGSWVPAPWVQQAFTCSLSSVTQSTKPPNGRTTWRKGHRQTHCLTCSWCFWGY